MATIEDVYSTLVREGVRREFVVVPEFCVSTRARLFEKKIDVAWLAPRDEPSRVGSLRRWKIVAAFEIEGYDVPLDRIQMHSAQFQQIWAEEEGRFPCFVPLYTSALHRTDPHWGTGNPEPHIEKRKAEAAKWGNVVRVQDGRDLAWLREISPTV